MECRLAAIGGALGGTGCGMLASGAQPCGEGESTVGVTGSTIAGTTGASCESIDSKVAGSALTAAFAVPSAATGCGDTVSATVGVVEASLRVTANFIAPLSITACSCARCCADARALVADDCSPSVDGAAAFARSDRGDMHPEACSVVRSTRSVRALASESAKRFFDTSVERRSGTDTAAPSVRTRGA